MIIYNESGPSDLTESPDSYLPLNYWIRSIALSVTEIKLDAMKIIPVSSYNLLTSKVSLKILSSNDVFFLGYEATA